MVDRGGSQLSNFSDLNNENGSVGLDGDAAGATTSAGLSEDTSSEAETKALDEEDDTSGPKSIDESDPQATSDGSGTSETDRAGL